MTKAPVIILSGPAGSGKTTVAARVLAESGLPLRRAITATTRPPRPGERDGVHYFFLEPAAFEARIETGDFLEHATVHGNHYGTPRIEVEPYRAAGVGVLLVIDVQGAEQLRRNCPDCVSIFLLASSLDVLKQRLIERGQDDIESIRRRVETAERELRRVGEYQYRVLNDDLDTTVREVISIIRDHFRE
jgi:guanylate kinase